LDPKFCHVCLKEGKTKLLDRLPLCEECYDFIDYVCENYNTSKLSFSYTTNATVVNKKWVDKLKKSNGKEWHDER